MAGVSFGRRVRAGLVMALAACAVPSMAQAGEISVSARAIPLVLDDPDIARTGALDYRGGFHLSSSDKRFGGLSGLWVAPEADRLIAVSDTGYWVEMDITVAAGALVDIGAVRLDDMLDPEGRPIRGKALGDAESLIRYEGGFLVSFERRHRVWFYPSADGRAPVGARPEPVLDLTKVKGIPGNKGLEGIALAGGRLVLMTEEALDDGGDLRGWTGPAGAPFAAFEPLTLRRNAPYAATDLAVLPDGDLLVLERRYSPISGPGMQIRRIAAGTWTPGATLDGPVIGALDISMSVDNMEGLAAVPLPGGETALFVVSDDNYNPAQRTLLMMFVLGGA